MYDTQHISVVVPCHNEEKLVGRVIDTMPAYVDSIIVVDDKSTDATASVVREWMQKQPGRVHLVMHERNQGVGAAIRSGYRKAYELGADVAVVMAGDAQMDPRDLPTVLAPVLTGRAHYAKGNRLFTGQAWQLIPRHRYLGNAFLSLLTKVASGYYHIADSQCGYTAISRRALELIPLDRMWPGYGYCNDILVLLNIYGLQVVDVPVQPVYNVGEVSGLKPSRVALPLLRLLSRGFLRRMVEKYVIRDFHPVLFFFLFGCLFAVVDLVFVARVVALYLIRGATPEISMLIALFLFVAALQFLLWAMWLDMSAQTSQGYWAQAGKVALDPDRFTSGDAGAVETTAAEPARPPS